MTNGSSQKPLEAIGNPPKTHTDIPEPQAGTFLKYSRKALGEILVESKKITADQLQQALNRQRESGEKVGQILVKNELIEADELVRMLALQMDLAWYAALPYEDIDPDLVKDLSTDFCMNAQLVPVSRDKTGITVAVADPLNVTALDDLRMILGVSNLHRVVCPRSVVETAITSVFERKDIQSDALAPEEDEEDDIIETDGRVDLLKDDAEAPIKKEVNSILKRAVGERASDIHIEPFEDRVLVRYRVDGRMREVKTISKKNQSPVISRMKLLAGMDITVDRIPQDGRMSLKGGAGRLLDVRVSTLPTKFGERVVMRLIDKSKGIRPFRDLHMNPKMEKDFESIIQSDNGIVLVTGPTGSGKSSTLATVLMHIARPDKMIITVEDPVEIQLPGVNQVEVNEKAGLTFASALRSILRQDPEVILVGEIRDAETAKIAVQCATTGHLVFSTLHTNDTASSVTRLADLGIEPFHITTTLRAVLAVRLLRTLCVNCREAHNPSDVELAPLGLKRESLVGRKVYKARKDGCVSCKNLGYSGRIGIYEFLKVDEDIKKQIRTSVDGSSLKNIAREKGMLTLRDSAATRFLNGETSLDEAIDATFIDGEE